MSGHSKFANIAHKKAANDAAKGKIFTRLGKELMIAVKEGGPDVNNNSKLRQVVAKCKAANMPNDTIDRAIKKAASTDMSNFESVTYEGYGPNGTAIIVEALTDNRNRAASNIRNAFTKGGGNVGTPGCVSFMFDNKGQMIVDKEEYTGDGWIKFQGTGGSTRYTGNQNDEEGSYESGDGGAGSVTGYFNAKTNEIEFVTNFNVMNMSSDVYLQKVDPTRIDRFETDFAQYEKDLAEYKKEHGIK